MEKNLLSIRKSAEEIVLSHEDWILPYQKKLKTGMRTDFAVMQVAQMMTWVNTPKEKYDTILFFGRANGDDNELIFARAACEIINGRALNVIINGTENKETCGHSKTEWEKRLQAFGVNNNKIDAYDEAGNTTIEAKHMIKFLRKKGWKSAAILAQPHQLLRCMCSLVKAMDTEDKGGLGYMAKIFCLAPKMCDFFEITKGSGNQMPMERWKHILEEWYRIEKYSALGHIATPEEVIIYYQAMNEGKLSQLR